MWECYFSLSNRATHGDVLWWHSVKQANVCNCIETEKTHSCLWLWCPETNNLPWVGIKRRPLTSGSRFRLKLHERAVNQTLPVTLAPRFPRSIPKNPPSKSSRLRGENTGLALCFLLRSTCGSLAPFVRGPQFNEHNLMEARSYLLFAVRRPTRLRQPRPPPPSLTQLWDL